MDYPRAIQCAVLADEVYGSFSNLRFSGFPDSKPELYENLATDTQCAIVPGNRPKAIFVVFRGTEKNEDWKTNVDFSRELFEVRRTEVPAADAPRDRQIVPVTDLASDAPRALMHEGFVKAYMSVQDQIHRYLRGNEITEVTVTGHSLGGALATLCAIDIQLTYKGAYTLDIYTYGSPKVGNPSFIELFNRHVPQCYRFVNGLDIVPALPQPWQGYRHVDTEYRIGSRFSWQFFSRRVADHAMAEYVASLRKQAG